MMKKRIVFLVAVTSICLLCSCDPTVHQTNRLVEGCFVTDDGSYSLVVRPISKEQFFAADGLNVVFDKAKTKVWDYYQISFQNINNKNEQFDFYNLKLENRPTEPCTYIDDRGNTIAQLSFRNDMASPAEYSISFDDNDYLLKEVTLRYTQ